MPFSQNLPSDEHTADFACARADLVELGVAKEPTRGVVVDVAIAAEKLDGVERKPGGRFGGKQIAPAASSRAVSPRSQARATV